MREKNAVCMKTSEGIRLILQKLSVKMMFFVVRCRKTTLLWAGPAFMAKAWLPLLDDDGLSLERGTFSQNNYFDHPNINPIE